MKDATRKIFRRKKLNKSRRFRKHGGSTLADRTRQDIREREEAEERWKILSWKERKEKWLMWWQSAEHQKNRLHHYIREGNLEKVKIYKNRILDRGRIVIGGTKSF